MKRFAKLAAVVLAVAAATSLPSPATAAQDQGTRVTRLTATKAHVAAMEACTAGDDSFARYSACQKVHTYERYGRCLRVELWIGDQVKILRDEC